MSCLSMFAVCQCLSACNLMLHIQQDQRHHDSEGESRERGGEGGTRGPVIVVQAKLT